MAVEIAAFMAYGKRWTFKPTLNFPGIASAIWSCEAVSFDLKFPHSHLFVRSFFFFSTLNFTFVPFFFFISSLYFFFLSGEAFCGLFRSLFFFPAPCWHLGQQEMNVE